MLHLESFFFSCQYYVECPSFCIFSLSQDYELQTMTYRAMVDSQQKSPVKRRRMQSSSDFIIQEVNGFLMSGQHVFLSLCLKQSKHKNGI